MKNIMLFGLLSACAFAAACSSDDKSNDAPAAVPAPEQKTTDGKETVDTGKLASLVQEKNSAEARAKAAEKKAADAEAALKQASEEKANPEEITKLTVERDEALAAAAKAQEEAKQAQEAATQAKADLDTLQKLEATVVSQYQGEWKSDDTILGKECVTIVRVEGKAFRKIVSCSTESGVGFLNQYEQGSLEGIAASKKGSISADFAVGQTSCQWNQDGAIVPVQFISESGSFKSARTSQGDTLSFSHPVRDEKSKLSKGDVCKDATGLTAKACGFLADALTIEPNHQLGCFVSETAADFRQTKEITEIK